MKSAVAGNRLPGRHQAARGVLLDRLGVGARLLVVFQRERRDIARAMAGDAVRVQNRRDIAGIGNLCRHRCRGNGSGLFTEDGAAEGERARAGDGFTRQQSVQRLAHIVARHHLRVAVIVDAAPVANGARRIHNHRFGSDVRAQPVGKRGVIVFNGGEGDLYDYVRSGQRRRRCLRRWH